MNQKLILNVVTGKSDIKVLKMPKEYKWEYTDRITGGNQFIKVLFKAKTKYAYEVTLHGKGGKYGGSGETKGGRAAKAEWDQPADNLQNSWVRLIKKQQDYILVFLKFAIYALLFAMALFGE